MNDQHQHVKKIKQEFFSIIGYDSDKKYHEQDLGTCDVRFYLKTNSAFKNLQMTCHDEYSSALNQDKKSYSPGWLPTEQKSHHGRRSRREIVTENTTTLSHSADQNKKQLHIIHEEDEEDLAEYGIEHDHEVEESEMFKDMWTYQDAKESQSLGHQGVNVFYNGGGYCLECHEHNFSATLDYLANYSWIDERTRAIFVEFSMYSPDVDVFSSVIMLLEKFPSTAWINSNTVN